MTENELAFLVKEQIFFVQRWRFNQQRFFDNASFEIQLVKNNSSNDIRKKRHIHTNTVLPRLERPPRLVRPTE